MERKALNALDILACLAIGAFAHDMTSAQSLPAEQAENAVALTRGGFVAPTEAGGFVSLAALDAVVRADAARSWLLAEPKVLAVVVEDVVWTDGSLGCPRPGQLYTQAQVPGWRLTLRYQGRVAAYHASRRGQWLFCPGPVLTLPSSGDASR